MIDFLRVKKLKEMSPKERGTLLEKLKACSRCTSWRHSRQSCPSPPTKCSTAKSDGTKCDKDHSYLVHDSGVAYCGVTKSLQSSSTSSSKFSNQNNDPSFSDVNIDQPTVYYLQDVPVNNTNIVARTFFDNGSNRVLIRDD